MASAENACEVDRGQLVRHAEFVTIGSGGQATFVRRLLAPDQGAAASTRSRVDRGQHLHRRKSNCLTHPDSKVPPFSLL